MRRPLNSNDIERLRSSRRPNGAGRREDVTTVPRSRWRADRRRRVGHGVDREHLVRHRAAHHIEPAPAALHMAPTLEVRPLWIVSEEKIAAPGLVAGIERG